MSSLGGVNRGNSITGLNAYYDPKAGNTITIKNEDKFLFLPQDPIINSASLNPPYLDWTNGNIEIHMNCWTFYSSNSYISGGFLVCNSTTLTNTSNIIINPSNLISGTSYYFTLQANNADGLSNVITSNVMIYGTTGTTGTTGGTGGTGGTGSSGTTGTTGSSGTTGTTGDSGSSGSSGTSGGTGSGGSVPNQPSGLSLTIMSSGRGRYYISGSWSSQMDASSYTYSIYNMTNPQYYMEDIDTTNTYISSFYVTGLSITDILDLQVVANNGNGSSTMAHGYQSLTPL